MRVLYVIGELGIGGAETALLRLVSRAGTIEPMVVSMKPLFDACPVTQQMRSAGITVHGLNLSRYPSAALMFPNFKRIIDGFRPSAIHGWMYYGNILASLTNGKMPVLWSIRQSIYDFHCDSWMRRTIIKTCAKLSGRPASIIYNSEIAMEQHRALGFSPRHQVFIPNGFDCEQFRPDSEARLRVRTALGVPSNAVLIGLIARFDPYKDHATFLKAARIVTQKTEDAYFLLAGNGITETNFDLMRLIAANGLKDRVFLLGPRSDIPEITAALDIACSSSLSEGFPNVIGEAMSCGVPCVVTNVGESANLVSDTGVSVPPRSPEMFAAALIQLIEKGSTDRGQQGAAARKRIEQHYSLALSIQKHERLYSTL